MELIYCGSCCFSFTSTIDSYMLDYQSFLQQRWQYRFVGQIIYSSSPLSRANFDRGASSASSNLVNPGLHFYFHTSMFSRFGVHNPKLEKSYYS